MDKGKTEMKRLYLISKTVYLLLDKFWNQSTKQALFLRMPIISELLASLGSYRWAI
jgi:type II secretory pathway component PulF